MKEIDFCESPMMKKQRLTQDIDFNLKQVLLQSKEYATSKKKDTKVQADKKVTKSKALQPKNAK